MKGYKSTGMKADIAVNRKSWGYAYSRVNPNQQFIERTAYVRVEALKKCGSIDLCEYYFLIDGEMISQYNLDFYVWK